MDQGNFIEMPISSALGSSALLPAGLGFRNLLINGDFRIDQRNAGASFTSTNGLYGLDRWVYGATQASKTTTQRITSTIPGFVHSMRVTSTSAYTPVSNDEIEWFQRIEASQIAQLGWGTASAKPAVLSFWVKSSITGTFGGSIVDGGLTYSFPFSYTVNAANTAEYKRITVTPPPAGTWTSTGVGIGMHLFFSLGAAGTSLGTAGAWTSGFKNGATGQTNLVATNGATLEITGVQLEANVQPTPFEHRPIGTELALCQRYYEKSYDLDVAPGTATEVGAHVHSGSSNGSGRHFVPIRFKVEKRSNGYVVTTHRTTPAGSTDWYTNNANQTNLGRTPLVENKGTSGMVLNVEDGGYSWIVGNTRGHWTVNAEL